MSIVACPVCVEGRIRIFLSDGLGNPTGYGFDTCPRCRGAYLQRDPPDEWTRLEQLPEDILRKLAVLRHHCRIDFDNGRLWFVASLAHPIPEDPDRLLNLIEAAGELGQALTAHNWLVKF